MMMKIVAHLMIFTVMNENNKNNTAYDRFKIICIF